MKVLFFSHLVIVIYQKSEIRAVLGCAKLKHSLKLSIFCKLLSLKYALERYFYVILFFPMREFKTARIGQLLLREI